MLTRHRRPRHPWLRRREEDQRTQALRIVERASSFGVDARLEIYSASTHVFQYFWSFLPEAADALAHAGAFISRVSG
ncbi:hypothetical protein GCM10023320_82160 [Pseudonocardia adelaidensis]|uniref:Alpha/beta hydrolase family protein n=1 Tax=Pseudonocardia adelaidensis TaxID=648754 RepID=A0ABP9PB20_9PSEU